LWIKFILGLILIVINSNVKLSDVVDGPPSSIQANYQYWRLKGDGSDSESGTL